MKKLNSNVTFYSGVSVLTFLYICFFAGLYSEWILIDIFSVTADYSTIVEIKSRLDIPLDTALTDDQVADLLSNKVTKQRNLGVFAIFAGTVFALTAVSILSILSSK
jgi:hypothetical protein